MDRLMKRAADYCVNAGIIKDEYTEWFIYTFEKKIVTIIVFILMCISGCIISNAKISISFVISFFVLRTKVNGYHASKVWVCAVMSLVLTMIFLIIGVPLLNNEWVFYSVGVMNLIVIYSFAPYNHPNMHLSKTEIKACRKSAKIRILALTIVAFITHRNYSNLANGIVLGNLATTFLLLLAIIRKEDEYEK